MPLHLYNYNGLPFYTEDDLLNRKYFKDVLVNTVKKILYEVNNAWSFHEIEAPCLITRDLISKEYGSEDIYIIDDELSLKPETTASSYVYGDRYTQKVPVSVYQASKSFRKEQDKTTANMRFKEFYQLEFQNIYAIDTKCDYMELVIEKLPNVFRFLFPEYIVKVVESDRLPSYSLKTMDIEICLPHKYMEVASISLRNDVPFQRFNKELRNLEVAIGLDRLVCIKAGL